MFGALNPRQTVLITCRSEHTIFGKTEEHDFILPLDWHMPVSTSPQMYAISVDKTSHAATLIRKSKNFVVNFVPFEMKDKVAEAGQVEARIADKFEKLGLEKEEAESVDCARIKGALDYIECNLVNEVETGDRVIFIGTISLYYKNKHGKKLFHVEGDQFTTTI